MNSAETEKSKSEFPSDAFTDEELSCDPDKLEQFLQEHPSGLTEMDAIDFRNAALGERGQVELSQMLEEHRAGWSVFSSVERFYTYQRLVNGNVS